MLCGCTIVSLQEALKHTTSINHDQLHKIHNLYSTGKTVCYTEESKKELNCYVERVFKEVQASMVELEEAEQIAKRIGLKILAVEPEAKLRVFGSMSNACGLRNSDVNLNIFHPKPLSFITSLMCSLKDTTPKQNESMEVTLKINDTFLPHLFCHSNSFSVRIYFNEAASCNTCELIKHYVSLDQRVLPLVIFFKAWARYCHMDDPNNEGLPSYIYIIMVIFFLQRPTSQPPVLPILHKMVEWKGSEEKILEEMLKVQWQSDNKTTCGVLLEQMLRFFCFQFDFAAFVISINGTMSRQKDEFTKYWMAVEDPFVVSDKVTYHIANKTTKNYILLNLLQLHRYLQNSTSSLPKHSPVNNSNHKYSLSASLTCFFSAIQPTQWPPVLYEKRDLVMNDMSIPPLRPLPSLSLKLIELLDFTLAANSDLNAMSSWDLEERSQLVQEIEDLITTIQDPAINFSNCKLSLFGSSINGFGRKDSDLDLMVAIDNSSKYKVLRSIYQCLKCSEAFSRVVFIAKTRVPVLKTTHVASGKECDVSCYQDLAAFNSRLLKTYCSIDRRCFILGHALKSLTKMAGIADASRGTLSSYSYLIMLIFFLQQTSPPVLPCLQTWHEGAKPLRKVDCHNTWFFEDLDEINKKWKSTNNKTPGELWLEFLHFYAWKFDYDLMVVSIRQVEALSKLDKKSFKSTLSIEDPFELYDLGFVQPFDHPSFRSVVVDVQCFRNKRKEN